MGTEGPWQYSRYGTGPGSIYGAGHKWVADVGSDADGYMMAAALDLYAALEAIEWVQIWNRAERKIVTVCPRCWQRKAAGHDRLCLLAAALAKAREG